MSINIPERTNYSTLFSSLPGYKNSVNANISSLSSLLSDYSSIKSGSYGKLMKAYYSEVATSKTTAEADSSSKTSESKATEEEEKEESSVSKLASSYTSSGTATKNSYASGLFDTSI